MPATMRAHITYPNVTPMISPRRLTRLRWLVAGVFACLMALSAGFAPAALGADKIYWGNASGFPNTIQSANLNGSGGALLNTTGALVAAPYGTAIDSAAGRIYWVGINNKIAYANLDGTGGSTFDNTGAATLDGPTGLAIDPAARRLYWGNAGSVSRISYANLNGTGGGDLTIPSGATLDDPFGVAIDPASDRIYWANYNVDKISFASLSGNGAGGDITTTGATLDGPLGVALDRAAGRLYWSNTVGEKISYANLNGTGGGDLNTTGATNNNLHGVAIDPGAGRIYWANYTGNKISFANLNGSGGGDLATPGATVANPQFPALLKVPVGTGAPAISGDSTAGSTLTCSQGAWAPDLLSSLLYRVPQSFAYQWSVAGSDIAGAQSNSITAGSAGDYSCRVTARNGAGSATQTSAAYSVAPAPAGAGGSGTSDTGPTIGAGGSGGGTGVAAPAFGANTRVTLELASKRIAAKGPLGVRVVNANGFPVTGKLSGQTVKPVSVSRKRRLALLPKTFSVGPNGNAMVKLQLTPALRTVLKRQRKLSLRLTATATDPAGNTRAVSKTASPKL